MRNLLLLLPLLLIGCKDNQVDKPRVQIVDEPSVSKPKFLCMDETIAIWEFVDDKTGVRYLIAKGRTAQAGVSIIETPKIELEKK